MAGQINGIEQRGPAAGLHLAQLIDEHFRIVSGVDRNFGVVAVGDQVAAVFRIIPGQKIQHQLCCRVLIILPMQPGRIAQIDEEPHDDRLVVFPAEEVQCLFSAFIKDPEILGVEVGDEFVLLVCDRHWHDDFVHLDAYGLLGAEHR